MRICVTCKQSKPLTDFGKHARMPDGMRKDCKVCNTAAAKVWYHKTKESRAELYRQRTAEWRSKPGNAEKNRENALAWYHDHPENMKVAKRRAREWALENPGDYQASSKAVAMRKLRRCPAWANEFFVAEAYDLAVRRTALTGFKWHVDHHVPLRGKTVSGLHVENNLAVIPGKVNLRKGSRWPYVV